MQVKTIVKIVIGIIVIIPIIGITVYFVMNAESIPFETVCSAQHEKYTDLCENVGKRAHTKKSLQLLNDKDYGKIVGVAWRQRGNKISAPGQEVRVSESNAYYYIIAGDKKGYYFLRLVTETDAK